jgi:hypothetical protein
MELSQRYQPRLIGLSIGVILALLIWPATCWLVRSQLALTIPTPASIAPWSLCADAKSQGGRDYAQLRLRETAARHPDDPLIQLAAAVNLRPAEGELTSDIKVARLQELTQRFSDRPTIYAAYLRFAVLKQVKIDRDEIRLLADDPTHREPAPIGLHNTPPQLAAFDRNAGIGERLAPDNAYFPFMRAVGLFAAHRDAEAIAALQRAADKPVWTEYYNDELEGDWKLQQETFGTISVLPRMDAAFAILFPHYIQLRTASRMAIAKAVQAEQAGHIDAGLSIRNAVRRCGGLMRVQAPSLIGNLIGIAITRSSLLRPGGAALLKSASDSGQDRLREQQRRDYDAFLERNGHTEQIAAVNAEIAAGDQVHELIKFGTRDLSPTDAAPQLIIWWVAGLVALSGALWMLLLWGGAALLARCRPIRTGQGLPSVTHSGAALGLLTGVLFAGNTGIPAVAPASHLLQNAMLLTCTIAVALPAAQRSDRLRRMGVFALALVVTALFCSAFVWQVNGSIGSLAQMMRLLTGGGDGEPLRPAYLWIYGFGVAIIAAIPLVTLATLCLLSLLWRVPVSVGVARGLRGCAVPIACTLLLIYGITVPITVRQENRIDGGLKRSIQHEGRYIAELSGNEWPGPVH